MEKNLSTVEHGAVQPEKRGFVAKFIAHYKKYWWVHLIITIIVVLCTTLPLTYVAFPRIAQSDVDESELEIVSQEVTNPTPDSVDLKIESISHSYSMFHPSLDSFNASIFLVHGDDMEKHAPAFGYITIPDSQAGDDVPITVEQTMKIADMESFVNYNIEVLKSETFSMGLSGDMTLHEGGLPATTVNFDKVISMKGLNGLDGFKITKNKVNAGSGKVEGEVLIPNASVFTLAMGTLTMDLAIDGENVGTSVLEDVVLKPGDNYIKMHGHSSPGKVFKYLQKYPPKKVPFTITGKSCVFEGKELPYYTAAIKANTLHTTLDLAAALGVGG